MIAFYLLGATAVAPLNPPLTVLVRSTAIHLFPDREGDLLALADLLLANARM